MCHIFFIHFSAVEGHLGCFQVLAITNHAVMYIVEQMIFVLFCFLFSRQGFSVALKPDLELALVDQAGLELTEIRLPLPLECWD